MTTPIPFEAEKFFHPPLSYAPVYTWVWNAPVTEEETERQLDEMEKLGIKRFYILPLPKSFRPYRQPSELEPDYLTPRYFELYRHALLSAKRRGMEVWLYDEGGWPSGSACGKVFLSDRSLVREEIRKKTVIWKKNKPYIKGKDTIAAFSGTEMIKEGDVFSIRKRITEYRKAEKRNGSEAELPDLTKKKTTELFLSLTHDEYEKYIGDLFGTTVTAVFCDEPTSPGRYTYREELAAAFKEKCGVDIKEYIPYLFEKKVPGEIAEIKIKWYTFLSEVFCKNYLVREGEWCREHGMDFLGHMDKDDEVGGWASGGNFDPMRALSSMDVPGVDVIYRQIYPQKNRYSAMMPFFPRMASSVAAQKGNRRALTESFAVYGNGLTFEEMRYVLAYQAMRGINVYNMMVFSYGRKGYLRTGELPHFAHTHACFAHLSAFNEYSARLSYLFTVGERVADVALYYPLRDLYAGEGNGFCYAGELLEKKKVSFDILSDEGLIKGKEGADEGVIRLGKGRYTTVVLPSNKYLSEEGKETLERFVRGGGNVLCLEKADGFIFDPTLSSLAPCLTFEGDDFSLSESVTEDGRLLFIMNEGRERKECKIKISGSPYLINITQGKVERAAVKEGVCTLSLFSGEVVALYFTERELPVTAAAERERSIELKKWSFCKKERFVIGKEDFRLVPCHGRKMSGTGDWRKKIGRRFSGTVEYRTTFDLPLALPVTETGITIDLGLVKYSCEAFLNGKPLGIRVMPPYRYEVGAEILGEKNELVVLVKNTVANEFRYTHSFLKYKRYQLTQYIKKERAFEKSSLSSGLFGPVTIRF